jgi:hypothetical protein
MPDNTSRTCPPPAARRFRHARRALRLRRPRPHRTGRRRRTRRQIGRDGLSSGTFAGSFTAVPTANPNVLYDTGTFTVTY